MPGAGDAEGQDAEAERGRGRPRMSDEEREAAKERKRQKDRERRAGNKKNVSGRKPATDDATPDVRAAVAASNAAMVCKVLDILAAGVSGGEYVPSTEQQAATVGVWSAYLYDEGLELPGWVQVSIVSAMHVIPAFATSTGRGKVSGVWSKIKGWWIARRG